MVIRKGVGGGGVVVSPRRGLSAGVWAPHTVLGVLWLWCPIFWHGLRRKVCVAFDMTVMIDERRPNLAWAFGRRKIDGKLALAFGGGMAECFPSFAGRLPAAWRPSGVVGIFCCLTPWRERYIWLWFCYSALLVSAARPGGSCGLELTY